MSGIERLGTWPSRLLWILLAPLVAGPVGAALDGRSGPVAAVVLVGLWLGWAVGLGALLVPRSSALTTLRLVVPGGLAAVLAALAAGAPVDATAVAAVVVASLAALSVLTPWVGEAFVDGSSYGPEHRLPLRLPALFSLLVVPATWLLAAAGIVAGPLLLAARAWLPGVVALVAGWLLAVGCVRSLHQLTRRWVVLVPTGLVLHDALAMPEPQLFLRTSIRRLGPALAGSEARDLTSGAPGLALQLDLDEPVDLLVRVGGRRTETVAETSILFTPSRPRRLLDAAAKRRIPLG